MPSTQVRQDIIAKARKIVVKVGTSSVCHDTGGVNAPAVNELARQIAELMKRGICVTLVASGAIGAGRAELGLTERPTTLPELQAVAAVGQGQLMREFHDIFEAYGVKVAQVLLTRDDFDSRGRYLNIRNTLTALAGYHALPIINENDTVAVDEIRFGDNDMIAALLANMLGAELTVFLTTVGGVLKDGQILDVIQRVDEDALALATGERSKLGSGGMSSKLAAAGTVTRAGEVAVIAGAKEKDVLLRLLAGEKLGTVFVPARRKMSSYRRWIGHASRPTGKVVIDDGAVRALVDKGRSLLPSGVLAVFGDFDRGATVAIIDSTGRQIARGLSNYSSAHIDAIKGLKTAKIAKTLGDKPYDEIIHRNNMTLG